ncbi:prephenate dehydrogenase/arogenate dehydrogenase family protein [candidate division KSB1 bacterium]|nr:prephenate dehydrogenase/arogenate dehydrogenase family protein [candidate division KSB1 bacterium]
MGYRKVGVDMSDVSKITIIGLGLIGGSLGLALSNKKEYDRIYGIDEFSVVHHAMERGIIDQGFTPEDSETALRDCDLVFLCTPIYTILDYLKTITKWIRPGTVVCDVGSTKGQIVNAANQYFNDASVYFLGTHPMAGAETRGIEAADAYLFENIVWVLTPFQKIPDQKIRDIGTILESIGAKVLLLSPELHDKIAAAVSHLPQMAAIALTNLISRLQQENMNYIRLAAGGFRDMTRIASSPYSVWKDICGTNKEQIAFFIDQFIDELKRVKEHVLNDKLEPDFENSNVTRLSIPRDTRGFLKPAYDVSIGVQDKPGVIAEISTALANEGINIKDIEVLKVREGEGGTFRMSFSSSSDRDWAIGIIRHIGYSCYARD